MNFLNYSLKTTRLIEMATKNQNRKFSCLVCKKLAERDHKKGLVGHHLLSSMLWFDSKEEAIEHLKKAHPKQYKEFAKNNDSEGKNGK